LFDAHGHISNKESPYFIYFIFEENARKHLHMPTLPNVSIAITFHVSFESNIKKKKILKEEKEGE
jgi:hypothetical protein